MRRVLVLTCRRRVIGIKENDYFLAARAPGTPTSVRAAKRSGGRSAYGCRILDDDRTPGRFTPDAR